MGFHSECSLEIPAEQETVIFGSCDNNIKKIEKALDVSILERDGLLKISGNPDNTARAKRVFQQLMIMAERGTPIDEQRITYMLSLVKDGQEDQVNEMDKETIIHTMSGRPVKPKTIGQREYVEAIRNKMITFGIGPAGTGKTYLAMAMAIKAFKAEEVSRIILTRPAIEAGEKLGFLPGDLQSKIDPYLRPLYDALYDIMGAESFLKNSEKGLIEVAPLAYMRGRTLDNAFIILDEAQNTTPAQMKMFLTRIGFGTKVVVTGDRTQKDLPADAVSGLDVAMRVLSKIEDISFCELTSKDVVRHPLVQKIVKAYEQYEERQHTAQVKRQRRSYDGKNK